MDSPLPLGGLSPDGERDALLRTLSLDASLRTARVHNALVGAPANRTTVLQSVTPGQPRRTIYDCHGQQPTTNPDQVRAEGDPASGDEAVDEAYEGLGDTYAFYWDQFERDSIDDQGMPLDGWVHYGRDYDNAFLDGQEMVFGDGKMFDRFTKSLDVIGHELTHGVTEHEAGLQYLNQSGALNESISDVLGVLVKQFKLGQSADQADWLIGADLVKPDFPGKALRSIPHRARPGTATTSPPTWTTTSTRWPTTAACTPLGHPQQGLQRAGAQARRQRVGEGRADLVRDAARPARARERDLPPVRRPDAGDGAPHLPRRQRRGKRRRGELERGRSERALMVDELERIELARSGGFANIPVRASVATAALGARERAGVDALLSREPAEAAEQAGEPDRFQYDLTVIVGDRRHRVQLGERQIDERLRPLIECLERDAAPAARRST